MQSNTQSNTQSNYPRIRQSIASVLSADVVAPVTVRPTICSRTRQSIVKSNVQTDAQIATQTDAQETTTPAPEPTSETKDITQEPTSKLTPKETLKKINEWLDVRCKGLSRFSYVSILENDVPFEIDLDEMKAELCKYVNEIGGTLNRDIDNIFTGGVQSRCKQFQRSAFGMSAYEDEDADWDEEQQQAREERDDYISRNFGGYRPRPDDYYQ